MPLNVAISTVQPACPYRRKELKAGRFRPATASQSRSVWSGSVMQNPRNGHPGTSVLNIEKPDDTPHEIAGNGFSGR